MNVLKYSKLLILMAIDHFQGLINIYAYLYMPRSVLCRAAEYLHALK